MFRTEDYVTKDIAKLLRKIGFDEKVSSQITKSGMVWISQEPENFNESGDSYSRPTLYEAQRWIRNVHNLCVEIYRNASGFFWTICKADYGTFITDYKMKGPNDGGCWDNYEAALNDGIYKACQMINKKIVGQNHENSRLHIP